MKYSRRAWGWALVAAGVAAGGGLAGCAGPGVGSSEDELLLENEPLGSLDEADWSEAEAGCEGLIGEGVRFTLASAEYGLIAAIEADGDVRCVDTVAAVEDELEDTGRPEEARELVSAYQASVSGASGMKMSGPSAGDPEPEPNIGWTFLSRFGDPEPEPNSGY